MEYAPIVVFVYNRIDKAERLFDSLSKCQEASQSDLIIFSDAAKVTGDEDIDERCATMVQEVRDYIKELHGFKRISIVERESNWGLANSIISGVNEVLNAYDKVIVLEDDLVVSAAFLFYMNKALEVYSSAENVYSITGYSYLGDKFSTYNERRTYFLPMICSWSWATWGSKWKAFDEQATGWQELKENKALRKKFNFENSYDYSNMLMQQMENEIDSWAIRWYWSVFKEQGLTLFPEVSYVNNDGFDGEGTHTRGKIVGGYHRRLNSSKTIIFPSECAADKRMCQFVQRSFKGEWYITVLHRVKLILKKIIGTE